MSFGTVVPTDGHYPGLYRAVIDALAEVRARVLVTVGRHADPAELGPLPANVHVERWVAQASVMPHAAAMVAHGGAGTTLAALAAGVPLVLLPLSADQPINARRVAELGAGLALDGVPAAVPRLAAAVTRVLEEPGYRAAARRVAAQVAHAALRRGGARGPHRDRAAPARRLSAHAPGVTSADSYASTTAWTRSRTPSLASTRLTCVLTVASLSTSSAAISRLESPRAISTSTSRSRGVSSLERGRGRCRAAAPCARTARSAAW